MKNLPFASGCRRALAAGLIGCVLLWTAGCGIAAAGTSQPLPDAALTTLHYLLDLAEAGDGTAMDVQRLTPLLAFLESSKTQGALFHGDDSFGAPSAFHQFTVHGGLQRIIDYTLDADIPSIFFWPSSLRTANWTRVDGGEAQFQRLKAASDNLQAPMAISGAEHLSITPDQHTGAYYSYDVDKTIILAPYDGGRLMISIYRQQKPSVVGKKGWVLGTDDDWSYLYTQDKGLNVKGLKWARTYMYDSFGASVYWEKHLGDPEVTCGVVSWVNAGWGGINLVKPHHIKSGLARVAHAFCGVLENPRLPAPERLAATFAKSRDLPTPTLRAYALDYFNALERRIEASEALRKKLGKAFDPHTLLDQMNHDELYAALALDYLKKLLGRDPLIQAHPF